MDNLIEKIITVNSVTNLNPTDPKPINFKDENGDKYILWKTNKTGESVAYQSFKLLPYGGDGATIGISYKEENDTFTNNDGKEISYKKRTVVMVKKPSEVRAENQVPNTATGNVALGYVKATPPAKKEWEDNTIFGKCKTLYLVEAFKAHLGNPNIKLSEIEKIAEEWAKASMRILPANTARIDSGSITVATPTYTTNTVTSPAVAQSLEQSLASQGVEIPPMPEEDEISSIPF